MSVKTILACVVVAVAVGTVYSADLDPDVDYSKRVAFTIKPKGSTYKLSGETIITKRYLSNRSVSSDKIRIYEDGLTRVKDIKAKVDGRKVDGDDINVYAASDKDEFDAYSRVYVVDLRRLVKRGAEALVQFKTEYADIADFPTVELPNYNRVKKLELVVEHPEDITIDFSFFWPRDSIPVTVNRDDREQTRLLIRDVDYLKPVPYGYADDIHATIRIGVRRGDEQITPVSAEGFVRWYSELATLRPTLPDKYSNLLGAELADLTDPEQKLAVINKWIGDNIRYIAEVNEPEGGIVPHKPEVVYERRYGDCKDRAFLMSAIAQQQGIDVFAALVTYGPYRRFQAPTAGDFNHVICAYKIDGQWRFTDPTAERVGFGLIPEYLIDHYVLILDPDEPVMVRLQQPDELPMVKVEAEVNLDSLQQGRATVRLVNDPANDIQSARRHSTASRMEQTLSTMIGEYFRRLAFSDFKFVAEDSNSIEYTANVDLSNFLVAGQEKTYIPRMAISFSSSDLGDRAEDPWPFAFGSRLRVDLRLTLHGDGIVADSLTDEIGNRQSAYSALTVRTAEIGTVEYLYDFVLAKRILTGEDKATMLEVNSHLAGTRSDMIVLKREGITE